jgi:hypothetical protein
MTIRKSGGAPGASSVVTQNYSSYVLLAETSPVAGTLNPNGSGMTNPVMVDGTGTVSFLNIPQTYRDLKIQFSYMSHNTNNDSQYRISWWYNGDTTNNRYYSRGGTQATGTPGHNSDNTDRHYFFYNYNHLNRRNDWPGQGEIIIPNYSSTLKTNVRGAYGTSWNMVSLSYTIPWGFNYYNSDVVKQPVTRLDFSWESDVKFCEASKISLYGIGAKQS